MSDTAQIVVAIPGVGFGLATLTVFLLRLLRQDIRVLRQEVRTNIAALHARIDALYQALFSHKEPAA